jgi:hypothetical protein
VLTINYIPGYGSNLHGNFGTLSMARSLDFYLVQVYFGRIGG